MKATQTMDTKIYYKETSPPGHVYLDERCKYFFSQSSTPDKPKTSSNFSDLLMMLRVWQLHF